MIAEPPASTDARSHALDDAPVASEPRLPVPAVVWLMALGVAVLRALPFLQQVLTRPPRGWVYLPIGYIPPDWLTYAALVRQLRDSGRLLLANPFTTEPQEGRFVLLFHQVLGVLHAAAGIDVFWLLELSRLPLLLLFFAVLWRFLAGPLQERRQRIWACGLVALAGGLEALVLPLAQAALPAAAFARVDRELWHLYGWNAFETFYNPLWVAALVLLLLAARPLLQPGGPRGWRDRAQAAIAFFVLALTHSYTTILLGAILGGVVVTELALAPPAGRQRLRAAIVSLAPPAAVLAAITAWQLGDPVFRASAHGLMGNEAAVLSWLPITHGVLGFFVLRGFQQWTRSRHPWRLVVGGWLGGVALLSASTLLNGYHFLSGLHLPLCIAAAPALAAASERWRAQGARGAMRLAVVGVLLFASPLAVTWRSLRDARQDSVVPASFVSVIGELQQLPATHVLTPPALGYLVPATTPHRVWLGHWFLTPDFGVRSRWYARLVEDPATQASVLPALVDAHRIGAVVVPSSVAGSVSGLLGERVARVSPHGPLAVIQLKPSP